MNNADTKTLRSGKVLPTPVVAASMCTLVQILAENPCCLHGLYAHADACLHSVLPTRDVFYLWITGVVDDDGWVKSEFRDVLRSAVVPTPECLIIVDPVAR